MTNDELKKYCDDMTERIDRIQRESQSEYIFAIWLVSMPAVILLISFLIY